MSCTCARCRPGKSSFGQCCATGATGGTGPTGPTGADGGVSCCKFGVKEVVVPTDNPGLVTLTPADLLNPDHPGSQYRMLRFTGGVSEGTCVIALPPPASDDDQYSIACENNSQSTLVIANDPSTGDNFNLGPTFGTEASLEEEIVNVAATSHTYRTDAMVTPGGAYRVPGFYINIG